MKVFFGDPPKWGVPPHFPIFDYDLKETAEQGDILVESIEAEIEFAENEASAMHDQALVFTNLNAVKHLIPAEDMIHLRMFLKIRNTGVDFDERSTVLQGFRSIPADYTPQFHSLIGSSKPKALLLADRHNDGVEYLAACGSWATFGPYLFSALSSEEWDDLALANANEENVTELHDFLGNPPIIALGNEAAATLEELGLEHHKATHPAWASRFRYHEKQWYGDSIREGIR